MTPHTSLCLSLPYKLPLQILVLLTSTQWVGLSVRLRPADQWTRSSTLLLTGWQIRPSHPHSGSFPLVLSTTDEANISIYWHPVSLQLSSGTASALRPRTVVDSAWGSQLPASSSSCWRPETLIVLVHRQARQLAQTCVGNRPTGKREGVVHQPIVSTRNCGVVTHGTEQSDLLMSSGLLPGCMS